MSSLVYCAAPAMAAIAEELPEPSDATADGDDDDEPDLLALIYEHWPARFPQKVARRGRRELPTPAAAARRALRARARAPARRRLARPAPLGAAQGREARPAAGAASPRAPAACASAIGFATAAALLCEEGAPRRGAGARRARDGERPRPTRPSGG